MPTTSFRSVTRFAVLAAGIGAAAAFSAGGTAHAATPVITGPSTGSLGSISTMFLPGANDAFGNFIGGSVGQNGSVTGMLGSAQGSLGDAGSLENMQKTLVTGSSTGSMGSIGQIAGQVDPSQIGKAATGSNTASGDGSSMLKGVDSQSVTGVLKAGSVGLENLPTKP